MPERRNPVVRAGAILRKGGAHTKSVSGQRHRQRLRVDDAIDEWYDQINDQSATLCDAPDGEFRMDIYNKDHNKNHVSKKCGNKGKKKGRSGTAPSFYNSLLTIFNAIHSTDSLEKYLHMIQFSRLKNTHEKN